MAWEWVAPVVTGVVGVAGISSTYLASRNARESAERVAREARAGAQAERMRDERRQAYSNFLAAVDDSGKAFPQLIGLSKSGSANAPEAVDTFIRVVMGLHSALGEVELAGSPEVYAHAERLARDAIEVVNGIREHGKISVVNADLKAAAIAAMKIDLGYLED